MLVLIVEDDIGIAELIKEKISDFQHDIVIAHSSEEAIGILQKEKINLMLLDYGLPDMNGLEFIDELKSRKLNLPPFIVSTGRGDERIAVEMMKMGARDYVIKDINFLEFLPGVVKRVENEIENEAKLKNAELKNEFVIDALRKSEKQFRTLFEESTDAIFIVEKMSGRYVDANKAAENLTGRTFEELKNLRTLDVSPEGSNYRLETVGQINKATDLGELIYIRPDGLERIAQLSVIPLDEHHIFGIAHDITFRKKAEEALKESEELFRTAFLTSPDAININKLDNGLYININEGFTNVTGYTWEDVKGKTSNEIDIWVNPGDRNLLIEGLKKNGYVRNLESQFRMKSGMILTGLMSATIISIKNETHILSITRDISERKRVEDELKLHSAIMSNMNEGVVVVDSSNGIIQYTNPKFDKMFGYNANELINKPANILNAAHNNDKNIENDQLYLSLKRDGEWKGEIENIKKDGTCFWCWVSITNMLHSQFGNVWVGVHSDITDRVRTQKELHNYRSHLEEMIEKRTQELSRTNELLKREVELRKKNESNVLEALKKEKELNEMKSSFISTVSHEFRTPLATILSSLELIKHYGLEWDEEKRDNHFSKIIKSIDHLTTMIDDILLLNKVETGRVTYNPEQVNLGDIIDELSEEVRLHMKPIHELDYECKLFNIYHKIDAKMLRMAISNLLVNAIKYSPEGGKIEFKCTERQNDFEILVSDEGIGIPEDEQKLVFQAFYRAEGVNEYPGSGLGLSIVERSVSLQDGTIELKSIPGKGTRIILRIPKK